jgi:hypothetical protein
MGETGKQSHQATPHLANLEHQTGPTLLPLSESTNKCGELEGGGCRTNLLGIHAGLDGDEASPELSDHVEPCGYSLPDE